jgi:predicted phage terminase large subunit-like protein
MVFMPPRHGKSELVSRRLPPFIFGQNPNETIIGTSYSDPLASLMNRDSQRVIDSPQFRELFPEITLSGENVRSNAMGSWLRNNDVYEIVGTNGRYRSAGVGGAITGMGGSTLIIDDPIKNQQDADSKLIRDRLEEWYASTFYTRLENKPGKPGKILLTMTRWHEDDLAGRLLALARSDPKADQWTVLSFPALRDDMDDKNDIRGFNEPLWPTQLDMNQLEKAKAGSIRVWNSLYQQRPAPDTGMIIQRDWFKYYSVAPETQGQNCDLQCISADLTFKDGDNTDYVVLQVWGRNGANKFLLDQVRARMSFSATIAALIALSAKWPKATAKYIEDAANGAALIDTLKSKITGLIPVKPRTSKIARAQAVSPQFQAGNVHIPDPGIAPWVNDYVEEWMMFPAGKHDDQVDTTTQALLKLEEAIVTDWQPLSMTKTSTWRK